MEASKNITTYFLVLAKLSNPIKTLHFTSNLILMSKFRKIVKAILAIISKPYLLNNVLNLETEHQEKVVNKHKTFDGLPKLDILQLFPDFNETVHPYAFLDGGSSPLDLALLKALAKKYDVQNYLEIGTWRGESVANVASVVKNCYTLNLSKEAIYKILPDLNYVDSHGFFCKDLENVTPLIGNSKNYDFKSIGAVMDMVFIDGDHHYEMVKKDTQSIFEIINRDKSIIVWHDYMVNCENIRWEVLHGILDGCPTNLKKHLFHVSNTNCAVYIPRQLPTKKHILYELPNKEFKINISTSSILK